MILATWDAFETMANLASLSARMNQTCGADRVGYTGTVTAPAVRMARSDMAHSGRLSLTSATRSPARRPSEERPRLRARV